MGQYKYKIRTNDGKISKGVLQAASQTDALLKVRQLGGYALEIKETSAQKPGGGKFKLFQKKVTLKDRIIFTEQLAVMLNAGITLVQGLRGLAEESTNKLFAGVLTEIVADVEGGMPFSNALEKHPKAFSDIFCQMVRSAEKTGNMADILNRLTDQQQKEYELKGKVRGALMYPAIISVLLVGVMILVITFILPRLSGLFTASGTELPMSTKILLGMSDFMTKQWYILALILVGAYFGFRTYTRTEKGALAWDTIKLKIPVLGLFLKKSYIARITQSFASLAQAGVPVLEVFQILKGVAGNKVYERELTKISKDVENGIKVSVAIRKSPYFPAMVGQLVSVGEQSGDLAGIFKVLGEFFEKEVDGMAKNLSSMLEPIIMIVMGAAIGFILISVLQPIYGLVNAV